MSKGKFFLIRKKSGIAVEWNSFDEDTGEPIIRSLCPEDILLEMVGGFPPVEIARKYKAPLKAIEDLITDKIPRMMAWRDAQLPQETGVDLEEFFKRLPQASSPGFPPGADLSILEEPSE